MRPLPPSSTGARARRSGLRAPLVAAAAAVGLALTACSGSGPPSETEGAGSTTPSASATGTPAETPTGTPGSAEESAPANGQRYVAIGDSYTAAPLVPVTDTSDRCLRSTGNYPSLLARQQGYDLTDVSCVGATSASLVGVQQVPGGDTRPPQFEALDRRTDLVTIGIGGNDIDLFTTLAGECFPLAREDPDGSPCTDLLRGSEDDLLPRIAGLDERIEAVVTGVRDRAPRAEVVVVTYPQLLPRTGTCDEVPLSTGDYPYVRQVNAALSRTLARGARRAGAEVVDVLGMSRGHSVCADEPWVNGVQTKTARALALHPFAEEQQAVADAVADLADAGG